MSMVKGSPEMVAALTYAVIAITVMACAILSLACFKRKQRGYGIMIASLALATLIAVGIFSV
jgi:hypothetical protein